MKLLCRTSTSTIPRLVLSPCLWLHKAQRCVSRHQRPSGIARLFATSASKPPRRTFEDLGVHTEVACSLRAAFPNVQYPTQIQKEFIPPAIGGYDIVLKDDTGTGKSFGLILALLSKPRSRRDERSNINKSHKDAKRLSITSLVLVPHRDLAYQLLHWIESMVALSSSFPSVGNAAQVLVRGASTPVSEHIHHLHTRPPHILIGTPQAILEVLKVDRSALQLDTLSTVVVDEVDYLIDSVPRGATKPSTEKAIRKIQRHPGPTRVLLDSIFARKQQPTRYHEQEEEMGRSREADEVRPQLIMTSATLRVGLRNLVTRSGWFQGQFMKVSGSSSQKLTRQADGLGVVHCVLVVSQGGQIKNIEGAVESRSVSPGSEGDDTEVMEQDDFEITDDDTGETSQPKIDDDLREKFIVTTSPFSPVALEAIATAFALDVPQIALLVLPAHASVHRAVFELCELGVNAVGMDLLTNDQGRTHLLKGTAATVVEKPTLLVSTLASTRGLDFPELTHVFILGIPEGRRADSYLHIAGRVGRFGRGGKVISILESGLESVDGDEKRVVRDDRKRLAMILKEIGIVPSKFEHFE